MKTASYRAPNSAVALIITLCVVVLEPQIAKPMISCSQARRQAAKAPTPSQGPTPAQGPTDPSFTGSLVEPSEDYLITPGDVIDIKVDRAPELSGAFRVSANGTILMQHLGRVTAQQRTQDELAQFIADRLRGRYLKDPQVAVEVKQINSHAFFIQGAVNRPGVYQMEGKPSLLKLITVAGGWAENHGSTAFIIREIKQQKPRRERPEEVKNGGDGPGGSQRATATTASEAAAGGAVDPDEEDERKEQRYELIPVNINRLFRGDFNQNVLLEPGTIINIPPTDVFFVAGEVRAPGSFPLAEGTTLRQAISLAQGTTFKAATGRGIIFRRDPALGKRQEITVDINGVMSGKKEDIAIMANDTIIVPNSRFKSVGSTLLSAFGVSAARLPYGY